MKRVHRPLVKHQDHQVEIQRSSKSHGMYFYHCVDCNKWVAWLSQDDVAAARGLGLIKNQSKTINN